jgi:hypothetical protein
MAVVAGTIKGITLVNDSQGLNLNGADKTYLITADFATYDASEDTGSLAGVGAAISAQTRNGKTATLKAAHGCGPGVDNAGVDIFYGAMTVSVDALTFSLTATDRSTEVADFTTASGVPCLVTVTES